MPSVESLLPLGSTACFPLAWQATVLHSHTPPPHVPDMLSYWLQVRGALRAATIPVSIPQLLKELSLLGLSSASSIVNAVITELVQVRCSTEAHLSGIRDLWAAVVCWIVVSMQSSTLIAWGTRFRHSSPGKVLTANSSASGWLFLQLHSLLSFAVPACLDLESDKTGNYWGPSLIPWAHTDELPRAAVRRGTVWTSVPLKGPQQRCRRHALSGNR